MSIQSDYNEAREDEAIETSDTQRHCMHEAMNTDHTCGRGKSEWKDSVYMRIRLEYK